MVLLVQAAVMEGCFANGSAFGGTPAQEIYRRWGGHSMTGLAASAAISSSVSQVPSPTVVP